MQESQPERRIVNEEGRAVYKSFQDSIEAGFCTPKDLRKALNDKTITIEQQAKLALLLAEKLEKTASIDALTQVSNRTFFEPVLEELIKELNNPPKIEKRRTPIKSILIICLDINELKDINDTYGHTAGDNALKTLAIRLEDSIKREDTVFRVGGDEFVILLPITDDNPNLIQSIFERVKKNMNSGLSFKVDDKNIPFSISMGSEVLNKGSDMTAQKILDIADKKMYQHKESFKKST